jgi:NTE family protein
MKRALVLGGGGPVGIGWEAGLLVGLRDHGVDVGQSDAVVGTSAGSVVGFMVAAGEDLAAATEFAKADAGGPPARLDEFIAALSEASAHPERADQIWTEVGRKALSADTIDERRWLETFARFAGSAWPSDFACTALSTADGSFRVWRADSGVDPQLAIASSCAVPGVFPPVTIGDVRWMDGGGRDMMNPDLAAGHDVVLVVSCVLLDVPPELSTPVLDPILAAARARLDALRADGSRVEVIVPGLEMLELSGGGADLLDFSRVDDAYEAGLRQGRAEAARLNAFWD